jgi:Tfp pilus assembly protein PilP
MKKIIVLSLFLLIVYSGCAGNSEPELTEEIKTELRQDAKEFMETLREVLVKEMQTNGLTAAASVCSDTAQILTTNYAAENEIYIKRVSFRNRNAANYPDEFESKGLKHFEELKNSGTLDETTELFEIVTEGEDKIVRYMKPIFIQAPCLSCHGPGENISPEVKAILTSNYPEDKATGYQAGDLRGAVSVRKTL